MSEKTKQEKAVEANAKRRAATREKLAKIKTRIAEQRMARAERKAKAEAEAKAAADARAKAKAEKAAAKDAATGEGGAK